MSEWFVRSKINQDLYRIWAFRMVCLEMVRLFVEGWVLAVFFCYFDWLVKMLFFLDWHV
jgi:hypothetical protein